MTAIAQPRLIRCRTWGHATLPGLLASAVVGIAAMFLSEHYGAPVMLFALLLGMALHFLSQEGSCGAGIAFASTHVLRVAVGLLGAQITLAQITSLGIAPVLLVVAAVGLTIGFGTVAARAMGLPRDLGVLTGGAVAICDASAALAIASVLPKSGSSERDTIFTVIGVTTLSTIAMIVYPMLATLLHLGPAGIGIFLGGTIHDVAQVAGAGFSVSEETGHVATIVKLLRVALLVPIVLVLSLVFRSRRDGGSAPLPLPGFLLGFVALVVLNTAGIIPPGVGAVLKDVSRWGLVIAIAALGMKTSLKAMAEVGARSIVLIVAETAFLAVLVLTVVVWLG